MHVAIEFLPVACRFRLRRIVIDLVDMSVAYETLLEEDRQRDERGDEQQRADQTTGTSNGARTLRVDRSSDCQCTFEREADDQPRGRVRTEISQGTKNVQERRRERVLRKLRMGTKIEQQGEY